MKQSSVIILVIVGVVVLLGLALLTCIGLGAAMWLVGRGTEAPPPVFEYKSAFKPAPPPSEPAPGMADRPEPDLRATQRPSSEPAAAPSDVCPRVRPGEQFRVKSTFRASLTYRVQGSDDITLPVVWETEFLEEVVKVEAGRPKEVVREVVKAEIEAVVPHGVPAGQVRVPVIQPGRSLRVIFDGADTQVFDAKNNEPAGPEAFLACEPLITDLFPTGPLLAGRKWFFSGEDLTRRLKAIGVHGGRMDLSVDRQDCDTETGLEVVRISGTLRTKVSLGEDGDSNCDFQATVEVVVPPRTGIPLLVRVEGNLSGKASANDSVLPDDPELNVAMQGSMTFVQIVKPAKE